MYSLGAVKNENIDIINSYDTVADTSLQSIINNFWSKVQSQTNEMIEDPEVLNGVMNVLEVVQQETQKQINSRHIVESDSETIGDKVDGVVNQALKNNQVVKNAQQQADELAAKLKKLN